MTKKKNRLPLISIAGVLACACFISKPAILRAETVGLKHVFKSVDQHHPKILQAQAKFEKSKADLLGAHGDFYDPKLESFGEMKRGYYDYTYVNSSLSQNLPLMGAQVKTGWRRGSGNFAVYDNYFATLSKGEFYGMVQVPLLRDGYIDEKRTKILESRLGKEAAQHYLKYQRLMTEYDAASQYMKWIILGLKHKTYKELTNIAQIRQRFIRSRVQSGADPEINLSENLQIIRRRQAHTALALEQLNEAAIKLSLFYRDAQGEPVVLRVDDLPKVFPKDVVLLGDLLPNQFDSLLQSHPLLNYTNRLLDQSRRRVKLARNQLLPQLDVSVKVSNDMTQGATSLGQPELETGFQFSVPLLNRKYRGKYRASKQQLNAQNQELRLIRDKIRAEIQNTFQKIELSRQRVVMTHDQWALSKKVERAERVLFEEGASSLFKVNIREEYSAKARIDYYNDLFQYYDQIARLSVVSGQEIALK